MHLLSLAPDCFTSLFSYLTPPHLCALSLTCTPLRHLIFTCTREIHSNKSIIPQHFLSQFTQLNQLEFSNVKKDFDSLTKNVISTQKYLKVLILSRIDDRESSVLDLREMHGLECLEVHWAKFMHDVRLSEVAVAKHLRRLKLHNMAFSDFYYNQFAQKMGVATQLRELDLSYCQNIVEPKIATFAPNVTHIDVSRTGIMNQTIYHIIENCPELRVLQANLCEHLGNGHLMVKNHAKVEILELNLCRRLYDLSIFGCPSLQKIDISRTPVQNALICKIFRDNAHVPEILLSESYKAFENADFDLEIKLSPTASPENQVVQQKTFVPLQCRIINMSCTLLESHTLEQILQASANTIEEIVADNTQITSFSFPSFFTLPHLKRIDVSKSNITNQGIETILAVTPALEELTAQICVSVTDDIIIASQSVRKIDVTGSPIYNKSLGELLRRCPQLESLQICSAVEAIDLASNSLKDFNCGGCTTLARLTIGSCPRLEILNAHSLVSMVNCEVTEEGARAPLKLIKLEQSPQIIGRKLSEIFPQATITGFKLKRDVMDIEDPTFEELREGFRRYQNLHSTHVLADLAEKTQRMIEKTTGMEQDHLRDLKSKICLQVGHYRSIQGRQLEQGVEMIQEALRFFEERISLGIPENYFRIKYAYEVLLALYGNMEDKDKEFMEVTKKLHDWVENNKLDEEKTASS